VILHDLGKVKELSGPVSTSYTVEGNLLGHISIMVTELSKAAESHDWEPTPKDIANIQDADLFVYNSEYMETWVPSAEKSMGQGHA
ncbi:zinc ABC transporter substrate-binding protein, partial [Bacillus subtilis]|uniref:metal ABC transporter solute-binding protein, Zn/Mn family n=1 Tax=Bacillus subtilis TaxID=1423 RepID=UPI00209AB6C9